MNTRQTMNTRQKFILAIVVMLLVSMMVCMTGCGSKVDATGLWKDATYTQDTELGEGEKTVSVDVEAKNQKVTFTIHTDEEMLGDALQENDLVSGDEGEYGLYIKVVNGMRADYDKDKAYWAFYIDDKMASTGVDGAKINEKAKYKLEYAK